MGGGRCLFFTLLFIFLTTDGSFSFTHCDGANTTDSWNISLPAVFPPGRDISNYYVGHNYVVLVLRLYTEEDFHLAAGILSGFPCHVPAHKPACMTRGQQVLAQAAHDAEEDTQLRPNALPTPEILAWMKHWGYVTSPDAFILPNVPSIILLTSLISFISCTGLRFECFCKSQTWLCTSPKALCIILPNSQWMI